MELRVLLIAVLLLALSACSPGATPINQESAPPGTATTGFDGLPALSAVDFTGITPRSTSEANNYICAALYCRGAAEGLTAAEGSLTLDASALPLTWAVYPWGGLGDGNLPTELRLSITALTGTFWLGFSDYSQSSWSFSGPYDVDTVSVAIEGGSDLVSADDSFFVAVVAPRNSVLEFNWLNLVTTLDTGKIYVDASATGPGDGSAGDPFTTVEDGVAAADNGDTVVIAPGEYSPPDNVLINHDIRIEGSGACRTHVDQTFIVSQPPGDQPVVVEGLHIAGIGFDSAHPATSELQVINCTLDWGVGISQSGGHILLVQGCRIEKPDIEDTAIGFSYADATATNIIRNNNMTGSISFAVGKGNSVSHITGNYIEGYIGDSSEITTLDISNNIIRYGSISDTSGSSAGSGALTVRGNRIIDGFVSFNGESSVFEDNYIDARSLTEAELGLSATAASFGSGNPTIIRSNTILVSKFPFDGSFIDGDREASALSSNAGEGVIEDNHLTGGTIGLISSSGAFSISRNVIEDNVFGMYVSTWAQLDGNVVRNCEADGIHISTIENESGESLSIFQNNTVSNTGGCSLHYYGHYGTNPPDFGGGLLGSGGNNVFSGYGTYALVIEETAADLPVFTIRNNYWGFGVDSEAAIAAVVWDGADDPLLSVADYIPFLIELP